MSTPAAFISDDEAAETLLGKSRQQADRRTAILRFTAGRRKKMLEKNCVAVGLAAGFMEPLESTSIQLIQSGLGAADRLFPDAAVSIRSAIDEYNRVTANEMSEIRDFLILHYCLARRTDTTSGSYMRGDCVFPTR